MASGGRQRGDDTVTSTTRLRHARRRAPVLQPWVCRSPRALSSAGLPWSPSRFPPLGPLSLLEHVPRRSSRATAVWMPLSARCCSGPLLQGLAAAHPPSSRWSIEDPLCPPVRARAAAEAAPTVRQRDGHGAAVGSGAVRFFTAIWRRSAACPLRANWAEPFHHDRRLDRADQALEKHGHSAQHGCRRSHAIAPSLCRRRSGLDTPACPPQASPRWPAGYHRRCWELTVDVPPV